VFAGEIENYRSKRMNNSSVFQCIGLAVAIVLAGCGGSDGALVGNAPPPPPAASTTTTVGKITGFGSIYVNGIEFDTSGATYQVDDAQGADDSALAVGMVVKVRGTRSADGKSGTATDIFYDDDIEGVVQNIGIDATDSSVMVFQVMGVSVMANANTTNFEGEDDANFSFATIANGDHVEVSGEYKGDVLVASYIEKQEAGDNDFEVRGTVDQYNGTDRFVLILRNSSTLNILLEAGAVIPNAGIVNGQFVEVEGTIPDPVAVPAELLATKVELEDNDRFDNDDDEVSLRGFLNFNVDAETWSVNEVVLAFDANTEYKPATLRESIADRSADGLYVEVEGEFRNDVLLVDEIESERDELEFKGDVESVTAAGPRDGTITLTFGAATGSVTVTVTSETMFRDDDATARYNLSNVMVGDKIEVKAMPGDDGVIYAISLHLEDDLGYEVEGTVDAIDDVSITVAGITFGVTVSTFFENDVPSVGEQAEVEDENGDGIADVVEAKD
jgi:Domain of unknown function (DUF5666)